MLAKKYRPDMGFVSLSTCGNFLWDEIGSLSFPVTIEFFYRRTEDVFFSIYKGTIVDCNGSVLIIVVSKAKWKATDKDKKCTW